MKSIRELIPSLQAVLIGAGLLSILGLPACASDSGQPATAPTAAAAASSPPQPLTALPVGTRWRLVGSEREALQQAEAGRVTLRIEEGRLFGETGCNQYSAGIALADDGTVALQPVVATKRGCMDASGTIEKHYFEALRGLRSISSDGDTLSLWLTDGDALRFELLPLETQ